MICGLENEKGLKASFYELEDHRIISPFKFEEEYQSYPGRAHGGMVSCMCDEIGCRAIWALEGVSCYAVTLSLTMKYRKPTPLNEELYAIAEITSNIKRGFTAKMKVIDAKTKVCYAEGEGKYLKIPLDKISDGEVKDELELYVEDNIKEFDI